ncbi:MAG: hypothetical protein WB511_07995 [Nitrososphaeraceae archaeon]
MGPNSQRVLSQVHFLIRPQSASVANSFAKASWLDFLLETPRQEGVRRSRKTISCGR